MEPQFDSKAMESFNQMVAKGLIEVYDYQCDDRETFLEKWKQQFNTPYNEEQETLTIYIGQQGKPGKFFECYEDFYYKNPATGLSEQQIMIEKMREEVDETREKL